MTCKVVVWDFVHQEYVVDYGWLVLFDDADDDDDDDDDDDNAGW